MKKITFILPNLNAGGAERVAINYMRQLNLTKFEVTLIVFDRTNDLAPLIPKGIKYYNLDTISTYLSFFALLKVCSAQRSDVIFTTHLRVASLLMLIKPFVSNFLHIARMPNMPSLERKNNSYGRFKRIFFSLGFRSADITMVQTESMKEDAINTFRLKSTRVKVFHNPLDVKFIDESVKDKCTPFPCGEVSAVASGRLSRQKGFDILIAALPFIIVKYPNFILYILGNDDGDGKALRDQARKLGVLKNINFIGFQPNPYLYYKYCDVFILSSRWEGFPNALLENFYLNTPIVSTDCVPIIKNLVFSGRNGYLSKVEDINGLVKSVVKCLDEIKRVNIKNDRYEGSKLESLL